MRKTEIAAKGGERGRTLSKGGPRGGEGGPNGFGENKKQNKLTQVHVKMRHESLQKKPRKKPST